MMVWEEDEDGGEEGPVLNDNEGHRRRHRRHLAWCPPTKWGNTAASWCPCMTGISFDASEIYYNNKAESWLETTTGKVGHNIAQKIGNSYISQNTDVVPAGSLSYINITTPGYYDFWVFTWVIESSSRYNWAYC